MPLLDSSQRERSTVAERKRLGELVSDHVRGKLTGKTSREFTKLVKKAGEKDPTNEFR